MKNNGIKVSAGKMVAILSWPQCASALNVHQPSLCLLHDITKARDNAVQHNTVLHTIHNGKGRI